MKVLTKRYAVLHTDKSLISEQIEYEIGTTVFLADGVTAVEFDSQREAELYITQNELVYEPANED